MPELITSIISRGSRPAFTPITIASAVDRERRRGQQIVGELHHLALARTVADREQLAEDLEQGLDTVHRIGGSRRHDRERSLRSAGDAPGDRRIDHRDARARQRFRNDSDRARTRRRKIDENLRAPSRDNALASDSFALHVARLGEAEEHDVGGVGDLTRRIRSPRPAPHQRRHRLLANVVDRETVTGIHQARGHPAAHPPHADKSQCFAHASPMRIELAATMRRNPTI